MWSGGLHPGCALCHSRHYSGSSERYLSGPLNILKLLFNTVTSRVILYICSLYLFVFYLFFSSGTTDISFMDPVLIGRDVFRVTNDTVSGIVGYIQDVLCAILDKILDIIKGTCFIFYFIYFCIACGAIFTLNIIVSASFNPFLFWA